MPMLKLGSFGFQLDTAAYQSLQRKAAWNWSEHQRLGSTPDLHFTGREADTIQLTGVVFPLLYRAHSLELLESIADKTEPQLLVSGTGDVLGQWVVTGVSQKHTTFTKEGIPHKTEFTLEMKRYA